MKRESMNDTGEAGGDEDTQKAGGDERHKRSRSR